MNNAFHRSVTAEATKLFRRRALLVTAIVVGVIAAAGTAIGVLAAKPSTGPGRDFGPLSIATLSRASGGTAIFGQTVAFTYVFLLGITIAAIAGEFTRGTFRTLLLQQPARGRLLAGKLTVMVVYGTVAALFGAVVSWLTARAIGPSQGIDTSGWITWDGMVAAGEVFARTVGFIAIATVLAAVVGVLARSVPIGVAVALVWSGPIENIISDDWDGSRRYFPGLLLRALISPASIETSTTRAVTTLAIYSAIALAVIAVVVRRRDVTC